MNEQTQPAPVHAVVHTPGPWHVQPRSGPGHIEAEVCYGSEGECITDGVYRAEDARLIAAAPDLLSALRQCLTNIEQDEYTHNRAFGAGNVSRDAIEKATGVRPEDVV